MEKLFRDAVLERIALEELLDPKLCGVYMSGFDNEFFVSPLRTVYVETINIIRAVYSKCLKKYHSCFCYEEVLALEHVAMNGFKDRTMDLRSLFAEEEREEERTINKMLDDYGTNNVIKSRVEETLRSIQASSTPLKKMYNLMYDVIHKLVFNKNDILSIMDKEQKERIKSVKCLNIVNIFQALAMGGQKIGGDTHRIMSEMTKHDDEIELKEILFDIPYNVPEKENPYVIQGINSPEELTKYLIKELS